MPSEPRRRVPRVATESGREVTGTAEPDACSNFLNGKCGFTEQQFSRSSHTLSQHVSMRRHANGLAERALEVARADACEFGKCAQTDWLREAIVYVVQDHLETIACQAAVSA